MPSAESIDGAAAPDPTQLQWNTEKLGRWSDPVDFTVERGRIIAYAQATNDENPQHLAGDIAPPVFAIVPVFEVMAPQLVGVVPGEIVMRGVHGQQDFRYHQPIRPGQVLTSRAIAQGITQRSTGAVVLGKAETRGSRWNGCEGTVSAGVGQHRGHAPAVVPLRRRGWPREACPPRPR